MKIYIVGCSGSGKSYMANELSKKYKIKHYELDDLYWKEKFTLRFPEDERNGYILSLANKSEWIIEGAYFETWLEPILNNADIILYIQPPHYYCIVFRIIKRFLKRKLFYRNEVKENIKSILEMLIWTKSITNDSRYEIFLKDVEDKVVTIKNSRDVKKTMNYLQ